MPGSSDAPGAAVTTTSAPLERRASASACWRYVVLKAAVDAAKQVARVTSATARAIGARWRLMLAATVPARPPATGRAR